MFPIISFHSLLSSSYTLFCWGICIISLNYCPLLTINVFDCVPFEMTISICLVFTLKFSYLTSFLVDSLLSLVILLASSDSSWSVNLFLFKGIVFIGLPVLKSSYWSTFLNMFVFVCYVSILLWFSGCRFLVFSFSSCDLVLGLFWWVNFDFFSISFFSDLMGSNGLLLIISVRLYELFDWFSFFGCETWSISLVSSFF